MRSTILSVMFLMFAGGVQAQYLSPLAAEAKAGRSTRGEITVRNVGIRPITVVIEPRSFTISQDGHSSILPLDPGIQVKLSEMSARLGAKQEHTIGYEASCAHYPCQFVLLAEFSGGHTDNGAAIRILIPSSVWICPDKSRGCREEIRQNVFHLPK